MNFEPDKGRCALKGVLRIIDRILTVVETVFVTVGLLAMVGLIFAEVVAGRLGAHLPWASELAMYWLVGLTFVGASIAAKGGEHIRIDALVKLLGEKGLRAANAATAFLCVCFFIGAMKVGWDFADRAREFGERSPALGLPVWIVYMALPLAVLLLAVRFALVAFGGEITGSRVPGLGSRVKDREFKKNSSKPGIRNPEPETRNTK